ncbi:MAG: MerR family transcriptional regulator [Chloroflexota bacterium]
MNNLLTIRQVAERTELSADTLRYYERIGLITGIKRGPNLHRAYAEADITWILFLKQLRQTGMSISQMKQFAQLRREGDASIAARRIMLEDHRARLNQQIELMQNFITVIDTKISRHEQRERDLRGETDE